MVQGPIQAATEGNENEASEISEQSFIPLDDRNV